jgi:anti-sigma B factor antagonist
LLPTVDRFLKQRRESLESRRQLRALPTGNTTHFEKEEINMSLKMTSREVDGVAVVTLDGRIVLGEETSALRERVKSLVAAGKKKLLLNMSNVMKIDSAGLGALVAAYYGAQSGGASLRLCNLGSNINQLLQITKLLTVFEVSNTEADAVRSFSK